MQKIHIGEEYYTVWGKEVEKGILMDFWHKFSNSSLAKATFYEYMPESFAEFLAFVQSKHQDVRFVGKINGNLVGMYWLNNRLGKAVMIHFCILKEAINQQLPMGNYVVSSLLQAKEDDKYVISALIGLTPKIYRHATDYIQKLGFEIVAVLPDSCYFQTKNKFVEGVVSMLTLKNLNQ